MTNSDRLEATTEISKLMLKWLENRSVDCGYAYENQEVDMAEAAVMVLVASSRGQLRKEEEEPSGADDD